MVKSLSIFSFVVEQNIIIHFDVNELGAETFNSKFESHFVAGGGGELKI